jgi:hypothetical protein
VAADALRAADPGFDEARFLARVERAFHTAQASWCAQDLEPLRPFVSDGVFERFSLQIEEQQEDGWRQGMSGTRVGPLSIAHVEPGRHFDTVTVRIPFSADIHRVERETGERIAGSKLPRDQFTELWSFLRRRGAKTLTGEGLIEGKCPNCGAPLTLRQSARCAHCACLARSGQFDWVLAEITQASEWRVVPERAIPGLALLEERDPGFNVQMLEDRASVAFWRKCAADRRAAIDPLTRARLSRTTSSSRNHGSVSGSPIGTGGLLPLNRLHETGNEASSRNLANASGSISTIASVYVNPALLGLDILATYLPVISA